MQVFRSPDIRTDIGISMHNDISMVVCEIYSIHKLNLEESDARKKLYPLEHKPRKNSELQMVKAPNSFNFLMGTTIRRQTIWQIENLA